MAAGPGITALEDSYLDVAMTVRGGYRYFFTPNVAAGLSADLQGIVGDMAYAWMPHVAADLHLRF